MNIDEYEKQRETYVEFAEAVKRELEKAFETAGENIKPPQAITFRAKEVRSLRAKLKDRNLLASDTIENEIKDLAGVRIIFYTNNDVENFRGSRISIHEKFVVEQNGTKVHYPNQENDDIPYKATHHIIRLDPEVLTQPGYLKFKNLRCEIQIQTMLSHLWAEVSHDILYKKPAIENFGEVKFKAIEKRMRKIAIAYLEPADHEFDKVQDDFERLMQGKELFDRDMLEVLACSSDNNKRYDIITTIKEYVVPNYDDFKKVYQELAQALCNAVIVARQTAPKQVPINFRGLSGYIDGRTAQDITKLVIDILAGLRYVDVDITFRALIKIFHDEPDDKVRKHILEAVKQLAKYNIDVWEQAGPCVQFRLTELLQELPATDRVALKSVFRRIWREVLSPTLRGVSRETVDTLVIKSGTVVVSTELKQARRKAIDGLIGLFDRVELLSEKKEIFSDVMGAMSVPPPQNDPTALYVTMIADAGYIANLLLERISGRPYELLQHIEREMLSRYRQARRIASNNEFDCKDEAESLRQTIRELRDKINMDERYVRYNILIGYNSVLPSDWEEENHDYDNTKKCRQEKSLEYINDISMGNENEWHDLIIQCAATEPRDVMTFCIFDDFLRKLAKDKPDIMLAWLRRSDEHLLKFLPIILNGLSGSSASAGYQSLIASYLEEDKHLAAIAKHFQALDSPPIDQTKALLSKAMGNNDNSAIIGSVALAVVKHESSPDWIGAIFIPALQHLTSAKDHRWIYRFCFIPNLGAFVKRLSSEKIRFALNGLLLAPEITGDNGTERFLGLIVARDPKAVWEFFGQRIAKTPEIKDYEAVPCSFDFLNTSLFADADLAIDMVRNWYRPDDQFRYGGGRLLHAVLPEFTDAMVTKFTNIAETGSDQDLDFILDTMSNYPGDTVTLPVLMAVVAKLPIDDDRLEKVKLRIIKTGLVSGDDGFVEAYRAKKKALQDWCNGPRLPVKNFVTKSIQWIDSNIASEKQRADRESARRQLDFDG